MSTAHIKRNVVSRFIVHRVRVHMFYPPDVVELAAENVAAKPNRLSDIRGLILWSCTDHWRVIQWCYRQTYLFTRTGKYWL